ncbi:hypothetical protein HPB48_025822 [Haemaphysalis longicornis]|uniref:Peptidase M13 N-terminal domain-containing protein n=1 Tax=Haemaphysalis longicornis TaxID=44386 RepID=A0A9J6HAL9_HAELO|nr:hypothetical protein HPB48_025822 [Haemaphysalis longicornis]
MLLLAAVVAFVLSARPAKLPGKDVHVCSSIQCIHHAELILSKLNWTVDPCSDFETFVCSKWKAPTNPYRQATVLDRFAIEAWFNYFRTVFTEGTRRLAVGSKARAMFEVCLTNTGSNEVSSASLLKEFMHKRKIPWPDDPLPGVTPLGVLLDLAYNWRIGIWFDLKSFRPPMQSAKHALLFSPARTAILFANYMEEAISAQDYIKYWNRLHEAYATYPSRRNDSEVLRIRQIEHDVFHQLGRVLQEKVSEPVQCTLADIANITPGLPSVEWMRELNKSAEVPGGYAPTDLISTNSAALLQTVDTVLRQHSWHDLLLHISWFFVQALSPLEDRNLLPPGKNNWTTIDRLRRLCASRVEVSYRVLIRSMVVSHLTDRRSRATIDGVLKQVKDIAKKKVSNLVWINDDSFKRTASLKLQDTKAVIWPPEKLLTDEGLSTMYANFSRNEKSLVAFWINALEATRALRDKPEYEEALTFPLNFNLPFFMYDYILNAVFVSAAALFVPQYSGHGTKSMIYGGLGFSYATQLVKALNSGGLRVYPNGSVIAGWWAPANWAEVLANRSSSCYGTSPNRSVFTNLLALEAAHTAYKAGTYDAVPGNLITKVFSDEQVFFITVCLSLCDLPRTINTSLGDCNKAVANFRKFAEAFKCGEHTPMNNAGRCLLFEP